MESKQREYEEDDAVIFSGAYLSLWNDEVMETCDKACDKSQNGTPISIPGRSLAKRMWLYPFGYRA